MPQSPNRCLTNNEAVDELQDTFLQQRGPRALSILIFPSRMCLKEARSELPNNTFLAPSRTKWERYSIRFSKTTRWSGSVWGGDDHVARTTHHGCRPWMIPWPAIWQMLRAMLYTQQRNDRRFPPMVIVAFRMLGQPPKTNCVSVLWSTDSTIGAPLKLCYFFGPCTFCAEIQECVLKRMGK